jgi:hypothetical protein
MTQPEAWFQLSAAHAPWGEWGDVLVHGFADRDEVGRLELARAGPLAPPISLPAVDAIVVTDAARRALEATTPGLLFREVVVVRVVRIDWEGWDRQAAEPPHPLQVAEPEDLMFDHPHDPSLAAAVGPLWELHAGPGVSAGEAHGGRAPWLSQALADRLCALGAPWIAAHPAVGLPPLPRLGGEVG